MTENAQRRDLKAEYRDSRPDAGVYRIVNRQDGRFMVGSSSNLRSIQNRLEFARSTNSPGALDPKLKTAVQEHGFDALTFEVLERLEVGPDTRPASIRDDLATLEQLWRERLGPDSPY